MAARNGNVGILDDGACTIRRLSRRLVPDLLQNIAGKATKPKAGR
jgi:hypothetical protein